ncbi:YHS domain-containing protein [Citrifermentans bremense]|uniref:YHS domain-containing protein n=1 Tax=Citrifermentans bremense TaxID=60035 RepID=UPI000426BEED|nr:YHS domain-containing protein [Citrifermentans bremense]
MGSLTTLEERIIEKLAQHKKQLAVKQQQLDQSMKELLEQRERLSAVAESRVETVIMPRLERLARQFQNAEIEVVHTDEGFISTCRFAHTPQFPATVRLSIELLPASSDQLTARYDLSILPALMEYSQNAEKNIQLGDEESLAAWVEDRVLAFLDDYLRLETHPLYQKDNLVIDVVCGMHISFVSAATTLERNGYTYYFCSEHCRDLFLEKFEDAVAHHEAEKKV